MPLLFDVPAAPAIPLCGEDAQFAIHRIFCVGRNYEAHAREMGFAPRRDAPIYFTKSPVAFCPSGSTIPYPPGTENCHYEAELVVALGKPAFEIAPDTALDTVLGYACGFDLTRRDLQNAARDKGHPWDTGKDFENSAVIGPITRAAAFGAPGPQHLAMTQNGEVRQETTLDQMIWPVPALIADLSRLYHLRPGDVIFTGTPAGVGPIAPGDTLVVSVDGLEPATVHIAAA